jgi:hypothetical protein
MYLGLMRTKRILPKCFKSKELANVDQQLPAISQGFPRFVAEADGQRDG